MFSRMNCALVLSAIVNLSIGSVSQVKAGVIEIGSQASFSASGTITQNTNFDSYQPGFFFPGSPFTIGDLTFIEHGQSLIGGVPEYNFARPLFTDNFVAGTTITIAGTHDLFAVNAGNFLGDGITQFSITTNLATYVFNDTVLSATNLAPLSFHGFQATGAGEYFVSVTWTSNEGTGVTDVQLGNAGVSPAPEPATMSLLAVGALSMVGYRIRKRKLESTVVA